MAFQSLVEIVVRARREGYAIGYFESWNLEALQGVVDAAEQMRSPTILGFNGEFLSGRERAASERLELYAALGRAACASATVPCGLIFNECADDQWIERAGSAGFNLVMPANPKLPFAEYVAWVRLVVRRAHAIGVGVEAEVGELPSGTSGLSDHAGTKTDPERAEGFVEATGVDLLAVSVGNVHVLIEGEQGLDLDRLEAIGRRVAVPLVLHGGSGIVASDLQAAIRMGVAKVNYGTYLKQRYLAAVRGALGAGETNPHELLGMGGRRDVMVAGRVAVRDAVLERIGLLGCCGKA
ncbi:MAG TPA: class II fructose-bisphosphate aldolase [Tepidisphaeraceae bacterium]|nr:class II fructose-bisphosphate aldolase [Tepidisphaeraceae bacterium]